MEIRLPSRGLSGRLVCIDMEARPVSQGKRSGFQDCRGGSGEFEPDGYDDENDEEEEEEVGEDEDGYGRGCGAGSLRLSKLFTKNARPMTTRNPPTPIPASTAPPATPIISIRPKPTPISVTPADR